MREETNTWVERELDRCCQVLRRNMERFGTDFPSACATDGKYRIKKNDDWTNGFWTGMLWMAYMHTGDEAFRELAMKNVESFKERLDAHFVLDHHDIGFLYSPSVVAALKVTGDDRLICQILRAADVLSARFQEKGGFIQAWGELGARDNYRLIIDCLLNLPLLYWASDVTGDGKYREIAVRHTKTSIQNLVREDFSTYHTFFFDPRTGEPVRGVTAQGYKDDSAWARGQAWGIYGTALAYRYTKDETCKDLFRKVTAFYMDHLPEDLVPYWDLSFSRGSGEPRDTSAAAAAVCGMMEMCRNGSLDKKEKAFYEEKADQMLENLIDHYAVTSIKESNGLLLHGVYAKSSPYNSVTDRGVDECNLWGDYFYLEALTRKLTDWKTYW